MPTVLNITRDDGLTNAEGRVADALAEAVRAYAALEVEHPSEPIEFTDAIHRAQNLLPIRIARRCYPKGWPTYAVDPTGATPTRRVPPRPFQTEPVG